MSDVNWRLLIRRRDHTFQPPVPENTAQFGIPNACTTCHDDDRRNGRRSRWTEWWGDGERRAKAASLADTMYRAGSGDATTLPALAKLAVDRSQGFLVRASAADYIGRLVSEWRSGGTTAQLADTNIVRRGLRRRSNVVRERREPPRTPRTPRSHPRDRERADWRGGGS